MCIRDRRVTLSPPPSFWTIMYNTKRLTLCPWISGIACKGVFRLLQFSMSDFINSSNCFVFSSLLTRLWTSGSRFWIACRCWNWGALAAGDTWGWGACPVDCWDWEERWCEISGEEPVRGTDSVSYTHLDVYKRQACYLYSTVRVKLMPWRVGRRGGQWRSLGCKAG